MKFDFESIIERRGKDALAVDLLPEISGMDELVEIKEGFSIIPMWVADMNFATVPTVTQAISKRLEHPLFGYYITREEYFNAIIQWQKERNHVEGLESEHIGYENGVLGGLMSALRICCSQGDNILLHTPAYIGFTSSISNSGYNMIFSELIKDADGIWRMDYEDMEKKIAENKIHCAVFCSPHNPTGRVWERWEIEKAMGIFKKYDVTVVSDEIWSDIILYNNQHVPTQSVSEDARNRTIALYAPSKTFNLAGLIGSYHIIYNKTLKDRILKEESLCHYNSMNMLSMYALIGAYSGEGQEWVSEMRIIIEKNVDYFCQYIDECVEGIEVSKPEGTYMLYIDCEKWCGEHNKSLKDLLKAGYAVGVCWQNGEIFKKEWTIRINLALPFALIKEAVERLDKFVFNA